MKKLIQMLLIIFMLLPIIAACNILLFEEPEHQTALPTTESEPYISPPPNNANNFEPFIRYDDTVIITVGRYFSTDYDSLDTFAFNIGEMANAYIKMLYEVLNVQVEVIFNVPYYEYYETIARHRAAGTLPDTFRITNSFTGLTLFNELIENGELADLTRAFEESIGGLSRGELERWNPNVLFQYVSHEDKIFAIPSINKSFDTSISWIRKDWLDSSELEIPSTIEDIEEVAAAFIRARHGGRNAPGLTFMPDEMFLDQHGVLPLFTAFGAYPANWIDVDGKVEWGGIQPEVREALALMREWTQSGIIQSRMLTMNRSQVVDNFILNGRSGIFFSDFEQPWFTFNRRGPASQIYNEDLEWVPILGPVNADGEFKPLNVRTLPGGQVVLATHSNPEAVIKAINLLDEVYHWQNSDFNHLREGIMSSRGTPRGINPLTSFIAPNFRYEVARVMEDYSVTGILQIPNFLSDYKELIQSVLRSTQGGMDSWWALSDEERALYLDDEEEDYNIQRFLYEYMWYWSYGVIGRMILDAIANGTYAEVTSAFVGKTPAWVNYGESLMALQTETFIQIISGRLPLEAFDYFVEEWLEAGGYAATNEVNELLRR